MSSFRFVSKKACHIGVVLLAVLLASGEVRAQDEGKKPAFDPTQLCGQWNYLDGKRAGQPASDENLASDVMISNKDFKLEGDGQTFVMSYKLNAQTNPVQIALEMTEGPAVGEKAIGIIRMEDGKVTLCYDPTGAKRPTEFKTTAEDGFFLFVLSKQDEGPEKKDETKKTESAPANKK